MHIPCQTPKRARIGKFAHESGRSAPALERFAPVEAGGVERFAPGGGAIRTAAYGGLERFASPHDALRTDLRDSLGLTGPPQPLPAPFTAGMAHRLERLRHVARQR
jgi:hypothetical protein